MAPEVNRTDPPRHGEERTQLDAWLDYHRETLLLKCAGLNDAQLRSRSVPPSTLSLLGLVRHMADVERWWFRRQFEGAAIPGVYWSDAEPGADFDGVNTADVRADFAAYTEEVNAARATAAGRALDETFTDHRGDTFDLRWVYLHMIEEYARHNGHADLLRQLIDGTTGE
ncbi:DinB family protein [Hamadaea tsunoensis]|uniref:DinB family protein n=1 Tax=Hamadaea tsunoensis TaxID=53368 RepID=UPI0003F6211C|nr:DinB family protein [Hamadaea tsunoensis]